MKELDRSVKRNHRSQLRQQLNNTKSDDSGQSIRGDACGGHEHRRERTKRTTRLDGGDLQTAIRLYKSGKPLREVASVFGRSRAMLAGELRDAGVVLRYVRMTDKDVAEATSLYESGLSLVQISRQLGFDHSTIWRKLSQTGLQLRSAQERPNKRATSAEKARARSQVSKAI